MKHLPVLSFTAPSPLELPLGHKNYGILHKKRKNGYISKRELHE